LGARVAQFWVARAGRPARPPRQGRPRMRLARPTAPGTPAGRKTLWTRLPRWVSQVLAAVDRADPALAGRQPQIKFLNLGKFCRFGRRIAPPLMRPSMRGECLDSRRGARLTDVNEAVSEQGTRRRSRLKAERAEGFAWLDGLGIGFLLLPRVDDVPVAVARLHPLLVGVEPQAVDHLGAKPPETPPRAREARGCVFPKGSGPPGSRVRRRP
jgi:hypothetical protein